jgi:hypothetical protein
MGLILSAVILYILVSVFARGSERDARWKILCIAIGAPLLGVAAAIGVEQIASSALAVAAADLIVVIAAVTIALIYWCAIDRKAAAKIVASYFGISIALNVVLVLLGRAVT